CARHPRSTDCTVVQPPAEHPRARSASPRVCALQPVIGADSRGEEIMGAGDGQVIGTTQIVDHGPASQKWNLVILSEGYKQSELPKFHTDCAGFVATMFATPPFDELWCGINVFRIDVTSKDSGAKDPTACGGTGANPKTYFDASFCNGGIQRLLE